MEGQQKKRGRRSKEMVMRDEQKESLLKRYFLLNDMIALMRLFCEDASLAMCEVDRLIETWPDREHVTRKLWLIEVQLAALLERFRNHNTLE